MKSKLSWIPFVPLFLVACFCKAAQLIFPEGTLLGLSNLQLEYFYLAAVVLIFLFTMLFCLLDKKISPYYLPHRNIPAGLIGFVLALAFAADGAMSMFHIIGSGSIDALRLIEAILLLLSAIVFVVLGLTHSLKGSEGKRFALFNVIPAILCAIRMILAFVSFTKINIRHADVANLVCYVFATMFFFNYAVALSLTKAKNAVKSCMIFGFPAVAALIPYGAIKLIFSFDTQELANNLPGAQAVLMGLYILAFLIELCAFVKDRDSVRIIDEDEAEEVKVEADAKKDGYVTGDVDEAEDERESSYLHTADTSDFLYQETKTVDTTPVSNNEKELDSYITETSKEDAADSDRPRDYTSRLDEIDKLILEISEQSD